MWTILVDGHSMTISAKLFSIGQVDFDKKILKFYIEKNPGSHVFQPIENIWTYLAKRQPMIICAKSFSNPPVSIWQEEFFLSFPYTCIGKTAPLPWRPCFSANLNNMNNLRRGSAKDHWCQIIFKDQ